MPKCDKRTCVDAFMALQSSRVAERSLAVRTHIWLLPTVNPQVSFQVSYNKDKMAQRDQMTYSQETQTLDLLFKPEN